MTFDPTKPARTRSGLPVRIICTDRRDTFPIVAPYEDGTGEGIITALADGHCTELPEGFDDWPPAGNPNDLINITEADPLMIEAARLYAEETGRPPDTFSLLLSKAKAGYMRRAVPRLAPSRDAQVVAYCLFSMGSVASVTFAEPSRIHPRTLAALQELEQREMIRPMGEHRLPPGQKGWKATEKMGNPMRDYPAPTKRESFPMTTTKPTRQPTAA